MKKESKDGDDKRYYGLLMGGLVVAAVVGLVVGWKVIRPARNRVEELPDNPKTEQFEMRLGNKKLKVEVRDDDDERSLGLSGRVGLNDDEGMLFVFEKMSQPLFWMKDMLMDIDVVWLREGEVMQIDGKVQRPTEENPRVETMVPMMPVDMVMELPAGWAEENELVLGDMLEMVR